MTAAVSSTEASVSSVSSAESTVMSSAVVVTSTLLFAIGNPQKMRYYF
jgi:hypothetical protein